MATSASRSASSLPEYSTHTEVCDCPDKACRAVNIPILREDRELVDGLMMTVVAKGHDRPLESLSRLVVERAEYSVYEILG
jgi:hypothetical protein